MGNAFRTCNSSPESQNESVIQNKINEPDSEDIGEERVEQVLLSKSKSQTTKDHGYLIWLNGDKYEGEMKEGKMHGNGCFTDSQSGKKTYGVWENDQLVEKYKAVEGSGFILYPNNLEIDELSKEKISREEKEEKEGKESNNIIFPQHKEGGGGTEIETEKGEFISIKQQQRQPLLQKEQEEYVNNKDAVTILHLDFGDGSTYRGEVRHEKMNGTGVFQWKNGNVYQGEWLENKRQGTGRLTYQDGNVYEGEFNNNNMEGVGVFTWKKEGGKLSFTPLLAKRYVGEWKNNKWEGKGSLTLENGQIIRGEWKEGELMAILKNDLDIANKGEEDKDDEDGEDERKMEKKDNENKEGEGKEEEREEGEEEEEKDNMNEKTKKENEEENDSSSPSSKFNIHSNNKDDSQKILFRQNGERNLFEIAALKDN